MPGSLHHVELWVPDLGRACAEWGWLLGRLGYAQFQDWPDGRSWRLGATYLVVEQSPALSASEHDRLRPGVNHLAFHAGTRQAAGSLNSGDRCWREAAGWCKDSGAFVGTRRSTDPGRPWVTAS